MITKHIHFSLEEVKILKRRGSLTERFEKFFKIFAALHLPGSCEIGHLYLRPFYEPCTWKLALLLIQKQLVFTPIRFLSQLHLSTLSPSLSFCFSLKLAGPLLIASICDVCQRSLPLFPDGSNGLQEHPFSNASHSSRALHRFNNIPAVTFVFI